MRKSISSIMLGVLGVFGVLASPAAAQPGQTPVMPSEPSPPPESTPPLPDGTPLPEGARLPEGAPMPPPQQQPPPGATRATFVSTGEARWDVRIDGNAVCSTPCALVISPMRFITLSSQERASTRLPVGYLPPGDMLVQAKPRAEGPFAVGVTFTALSGMGLATGITLTAVGYGTDHDGMWKAGLITGAVSAVGLYLSIDLLRRSLPRVYVGPAQVAPYAAGRTAGLAGRF